MVCYLLVAVTTFCVFFTYCPLGVRQGAQVLGYEAGASREGRRSTFPVLRPLSGWGGDGDRQGCLGEGTAWRAKMAPASAG